MRRLLASLLLVCLDLGAFTSSTVGTDKTSFKEGILIQHPQSRERGATIRVSFKRADAKERTSLPTLTSEPQMAEETANLLHSLGLPQTWQIRVDKKLSKNTNMKFNKHELPFFSDDTGAGLGEAEQVACPDMVVIDTQEPISVRLVFEFELDTNPKNLIGVAFSPLLASVYRDPYDHRLYPLDPQHTDVFLLACLKSSRRDQKRDMAAVKKGELVASWIERAAALCTNLGRSNVRKIHARAGHDWNLMKKDLESDLNNTLPKASLRNSKRHVPL